MAAPNLKSPTTITGKTAVYACTASLASALSNGASSGKVFKINGIRAANTTTAAGTIEVTIFRSSTHYELIKTAQVPVNSAFVVLNREEYLYLEEGDAIYAKANAATTIDLILTYEEIA
ncbi:hypothetical protein EBT31_19525 [bacterium]|jgi:hypothetical protein|nr:hypothetical protein [bacterium]